MPRTAVAPDALKDPHDFFNAPEAFRVLKIVTLQNEADGTQRLISRVVDQRLRICGKPLGTLVLFEMMQKNLLEQLHAHPLPFGLFYYRSIV